MTWKITVYAGIITAHPQVRSFFFASLSCGCDYPENDMESGRDIPSKVVNGIDSIVATPSTWGNPDEGLALTGPDVGLALTPFPALATDMDMLVFFPALATDMDMLVFFPAFEGVGEVVCASLNNIERRRSMETAVIFVMIMV